MSNRALVSVRRHLEDWIDTEKTLRRCLASHSNVLSRLRLLQKGASWESDRGGGRGDNADAEEEADDIACDVFDAVPDPALRQRLEEVHAAEVVRVERLMEGLLFGMEEALTKMTHSLYDAERIAAELGLEAAAAAAAAAAGAFSPRRQRGGRGSADGAGEAVVTTVAELEWMGDVVRMLSLELWRKEEMVAAVLRCSRELPPQQETRERKATTTGSGKASSSSKLATDPGVVVSYVQREWLSSSPASFVDWSRLQEHRKPAAGLSA